MRRRAFSVVVLAALVPLVVPRPALAGPGQPPPPPPPTPRCGPCVGPPSPPTPVPTLSPPVNPTPVVVSVKLTPLKVRRGQSTKITVAATKDDAVTLIVRYHQGKSVTYRGRVASSGSYSRSWKVPNNAPYGKADVKVTVQSAVSPYSGRLTFTVIH